MTILEFEKFIGERRKEFRAALELNGVIAYIYEDMLKKFLDEYCSDFEEETLKEHLQEELRDFIDSAA